MSHAWPKQSPTYRSWADMKKRCLNPASKDWSNYGGRGIVICDRWMSFANFLADMGERPKGMTLERNCADGNYEPDNCRWATQADQQRNRRNNKLDAVLVSQIRWARTDGGFRLKHVAKAFNVSTTMIKNIMSGRSWVAK